MADRFRDGEPITADDTLKFMTYVHDLGELVDLEHLPMKEVSERITEFENASNLIEFLELAASTVPIHHQVFWKSIINATLLKFQELSFTDLVDLLSILQDLGFDGLELYPEVLPDALQVKQSKLRKLCNLRVLTSYLQDQIDLYGNDLMYNELLGLDQ